MLAGFGTHWKMIIWPLPASEGHVCCSLYVPVLLSKDRDMYGKVLLETSNNFTEP